MDRNSVQWRGYIPAITTPFTSNGALDLKSLEVMLEWMLEEGMHGIIVGGTQGEWFSLADGEWREVLQTVSHELKGRMTLIAGCTGYSSAEVAAKSRVASDNGFDGILVTPPPYMRPTERETLQFYSDVNARVDLPICAYNWPPGTNVDMSLELLRSIAELSNVVAIKHSTGDLRHFLDVQLALKDSVRVFGMPMNDLGVLLAKDWGADGTMGAGAVLGRELPGYFNAIWGGDLDLALRYGRRNDLLMSEWFNSDYTGRFGASQAIFKTALNLIGLPAGFPRRPLLPLDEAGVAAVRATLIKLGKI